jgi:hypothetical protein
MNKNKVFPTIIFILMLVVLSLLTACQSANPNLVMAAAPEDVASEAYTDFDYEQAAEVKAFRWNAIARGYEKLGLLNTNMDPGDVKAFRWNAIARGYEKLGMLNANMDPGDVKAFRWNAIARGYERLGLLNDK